MRRHDHRLHYPLLVAGPCVLKWRDNAPFGQGWESNRASSDKEGAPRMLGIALGNRRACGYTTSPEREHASSGDTDRYDDGAIGVAEHGFHPSHSAGAVIHGESQHQQPTRQGTGRCFMQW